MGDTEVSYFAPGPAKIPNEVLEEVQRELVHYEDTRVSIMELSHRSKDFDAIIKDAEKLIREALDIPSNYRVLFLQGGGFGQFAAVPLNLISRTGKADYIVTGSWSSKAAQECSKYGEVNLVLPKADKFGSIPPKADWKFSPDASYVYYCDNETVEGVEFDSVPDVGVPLVCDMSSNICSRPVDVSKFAVIFAGAQKNVGCAGVTLVIARDDVIGSPLKTCPSVFDYSVMAKHGSLLNTPPTFAIHVLRRVLQWVRREGGVSGMAEEAQKKSHLLYAVIDQSQGFYWSPVNPLYRSRMNVTFRVGGPEGNEELEKAFLEEAATEGLLSLKGHRSVGGIRASLYNALTVGDAMKLTNFMNAFRNSHKK